MERRTGFVVASYNFAGPGKWNDGEIVKVFSIESYLWKEDGTLYQKTYYELFTGQQVTPCIGLFHRNTTTVRPAAVSKKNSDRYLSIP